MNLGLWVLPADVRTFANFQGTDDRYSDNQLGSNIRASERFLQRTTGRQWQAETATKTFTTYGEAQIAIPDLRSVTSVVLSTSTLTANESYWLVPSKQDQDVSTAIQLRAFGTSGRYGYKAYPDWFDRNLDRDWNRGFDSGFPNDLAISGEWGWDSMPEDVQHAIKVGAAFLTMRPDALLANAKQTPDGSIYDLSVWPIEFQSVVREWKGAQQMVALG